MSKDSERGPPDGGRSGLHARRLGGGLHGSRATGWTAGCTPGLAHGGRSVRGCGLGFTYMVFILFAGSSGGRDRKKRGERRRRGAGRGLVVADEQAEREDVLGTTLISVAVGIGLAVAYCRGRLLVPGLSSASAPPTLAPALMVAGLVLRLACWRPSVDPAGGLHRPQPHRSAGRLRRRLHGRCSAVASIRHGARRKKGETPERPGLEGGVVGG